MLTTVWKNNKYITTWEQFDESVRSLGLPLLKRLDEFPNSVMVTGCQRSGTTMLTRLITQSDGMVNYWFGTDDELDAALILSGYVEHQPQGRYCFQTTFINRRFHEYFEHDRNHKVVFMLRNPLSVIYSMLYNWRENALNRLFNFCGIDQLTGSHKLLYNFFGAGGVSKLHRACFAFIGKVSQLYTLRETMNSAQLMVIDYNDLVMNKDVLLPRVYDFIKLSYRKEYADKILSKSVKKIESLSTYEHKTISQLCMPIYTDLKRFSVLD